MQMRSQTPSGVRMSDYSGNIPLPLTLKSPRNSTGKFTRTESWTSNRVDSNRAGPSPAVVSVEEKMMQLQEQTEFYTRGIERLKLRYNAYEAKLRDATKRVSFERKKLGKVNLNAAIRDKKSGLSARHTWENRLDHASTKLNQVRARNKKFRQRIDNMRRENLESERQRDCAFDVCQRVKTQIKDEMERSKSSEISKQAAKARISFLKHEAEVEESTFQKKLKELLQLIAARSEKEQATIRTKQDKTLNKIVDIMGRAFSPTNKSANGDGDGDGEGDGFTRGSMAIDDEQLKKKETHKQQIIIGVKKAKLMENKLKVQDYEEAFGVISRELGIEDPNEIAELFIAREDERWSMYRYVEERNDQADTLRKDVDCIEAEITKFKGKEDVPGGTKKLAELQAQIEYDEAKIDNYEAKNSDLEGLIDRLQFSLGAACFNCDCELTTSDGRRITTLEDAETLTFGDPPNPDRMMEYLGMLEQKTVEILYAFGIHQRKRGEDFSFMTKAMEFRDLGAEPPEPPPLPSMLDYNSSSDEEEGQLDDLSMGSPAFRPLTRDQLEQKTMQKLNVTVPLQKINIPTKKAELQ